jgi:small-conductance mechanosensitive channel
MALSPDARSQIDKILAVCEAARKTIDAQQTEFGIRLNKLASPDPPRDLTPAEQAEIARLNAALDALAEKDQDLSVLTLEQLNDSDGVKELADQMKAANAALKGTLEKVQKTAQQLQQLADFLKVLDGIAQNLIKLSTLLI